jgi:hypothetical protein
MVNALSILRMASRIESEDSPAEVIKKRERDVMDEEKVKGNTYM